MRSNIVSFYDWAAKRAPDRAAASHEGEMDHQRDPDLCHRRGIVLCGAVRGGVVMGESEKTISVMGTLWTIEERSEAEDKLPQPYRIVLVCSKRGEVSTGYHNGAGEWIDAQVDPVWWMMVPAVPEEVET